MRKGLILFLFVLLSISLFSSIIDSDLQNALNLASDNDIFTVVIHMKDQFDAKGVADRLRAEGLSRAEIHRSVINGLKDKALNTQSSLMQFLNSESLKNNVKKYESFWIFNGFVVTATKKTILELAERDDIELIRPILIFYLPQNEFDNQPTSKDRDEVKDYGVKLIKADQLWALGIDGTGIIVANIDTGVNYYHKDLKDKWLGNTKPHSKDWFDRGAGG